MRMRVARCESHTSCIMNDNEDIYLLHVSAAFACHAFPLVPQQARRRQPPEIREHAKGNVISMGITSPMKLFWDVKSNYLGYARAFVISGCLVCICIPTVLGCLRCCAETRRGYAALNCAEPALLAAR